jgi:hypothetical protein
MPAYASRRKGNILILFQWHGGVAQRTSHPPQDLTSRVRIPQGFLWGNHSYAVVYNWLRLHCLCAEGKNKGIGRKLFFKHNFDLRYLFDFFCRLCMCESVTCCEGPTHNWHIFLGHWARSLPQDWNPSCHNPLLWGIHVMLLLEMCL